MPAGSTLRLHFFPVHKVLWRVHSRHCMLTHTTVCVLLCPLYARRTPQEVRSSRTHFRCGVCVSRDARGRAYLSSLTNGNASPIGPVELANFTCDGHDCDAPNAQASRDLLLQLLKFYFICRVGNCYDFQWSELRLYVGPITRQLVASYCEQLAYHYDAINQV